MTTPDQQDFVLAHGLHTARFSDTPMRPSAYPAKLKFECVFGALLFLALPLEIGFMGIVLCKDQLKLDAADTKRYRDLMKTITWSGSADALVINISTEAYALKRDDAGSIDFWVLTTVDFTPPYERIAYDEGKSVETRSFFQDTISFGVKPASGSPAVVLAPAGTVPDNVASEVTYRTEQTFTFNVGFSAKPTTDPVTTNVGLSISRGVSAQTTTQDFGLAQQSLENGVVWNATMHNLTTGDSNQPDPDGYSAADPSTIFNGRMITKRLKNPGHLSGSKASMQFSTAFSAEGAVAEQVMENGLTLEWNAAQRLIHAVLAGQYGANADPNGGVPLVIPALSGASGNIRFDLKAGQVYFENESIVSTDVFGNKNQGSVG